MTDNTLPEPWLRGTLSEVSPVLRAVLHALELAQEDLHRHCGSLSDQELNERPLGLPSVAFHLRHIARSMDRLLTYAEGQQLDDRQAAARGAELEERSTREELLGELDAAFKSSARRVRRFEIAGLEASRAVGKGHRPSTVAGLLIHVADHTQRHVGQAVTTAQLIQRQHHPKS